MKADILLVDGYNVIFAWPELKRLSKQSLSHARSRLRHILQNYGMFKGYYVSLVFDGKYAGMAPAEEEVSPDFLEVYTAEGVTADSYIEKAVFIRKNSFRNIYVCTSDHAEQNQILGSGGLRISARELLRQVERAKLDERRHYRHTHTGDSVRLERNEFGRLIEGTKAAEGWETMRLNGKKRENKE